MKNLKRNSIIILLITLVVLFFVMKDDFSSIVDLLVGANMFWIFVALLFSFLFIFFDSLCFYGIAKEYSKKYKFKNALRLITITKFFNGITPFSTGGQPMQVYMLKKEGFRITKSTNIIIQNFILYQAALVLMGVIALVLNYQFDILKDVDLLNQLITLGFIINFLVMVVLIIISFSEKFNKFIINKMITILNKLKIVKDKEKALEKWTERCEDFYEGATYLRKNKKVCIFGVLYEMLSLFSQYLTPIFVVLAFNGKTDLTVMNTFVASAYVAILGSFVPLPGGSGGVEYGFMQFFGNFLKSATLSATLLIWRFVTYYIPMVVGAIVFNVSKGDDNVCE